MNDRDQPYHPQICLQRACKRLGRFRQGGANGINHRDPKVNPPLFCDAAALLTFVSPASFIPDHMTEPAVQERLEALMETDWHSAATVLLQEREERGARGQGLLCESTCYMPDQ